MAFQSIYTGEQIERAVGAAQNIGSFSATLLSTDWAGEDAPFIQTLSIEGITGADRPVIDIVQSEDQETAEAELEAAQATVRDAELLHSLHPEVGTV